MSLSISFSTSSIRRLERKIVPSISKIATFFMLSSIPFPITYLLQDPKKETKRPAVSQAMGTTLAKRNNVTVK